MLRGGVANLVGLPKDLTTAHRVISAQRSRRKTSKNLCGLCDLRGEWFSQPILLATLSEVVVGVNSC